MSRVNSIRQQILAMKDAEARSSIVKASTILNTWQATQGAFLDISHITNQLQSLNGWENMVIWASECGLTGIDINLLYQEYRNLTLFLNVWRVAASAIDAGSKNRQEVIEWFRQYKKDVFQRQERKRMPEEVLKELEELI